MILVSAFSYLSAYDLAFTLGKESQAVYTGQLPPAIEDFALSWQMTVQSAFIQDIQLLAVDVLDGENNTLPIRMIDVQILQNESIMVNVQG